MFPGGHASIKQYGTWVPRDNGEIDFLEPEPPIVGEIRLFGLRAGRVGFCSGVRASTSMGLGKSSLRHLNSGW